MIQSAIQRGNYVYVYNEKNQQIFSQSGTLQGYTSTSVSVKNGNYVSVYNDKGQKIASHYSN